MITKIGKEESIRTACDLIKQGELVVFPTETVYGLGADAFNAKAVAKIFAAKERPADNPLIVHLARWEDIFSVAEYVPPIAEALYKRYCPGPLTMILKKKKSVPDIVTAGRDTVGIRFPSHPMARALILGSSPIAAPSANLAKHVSPTLATHAYEDLKGRVPLVLDGGECSVGIESTIIDLTGEKPTVLRPGAITLEELQTICEAENYHGELGVALAPGMKYKHYSPNCRCVMKNAEELGQAYQEAVSLGKNPVLIATEQTLVLYPQCNAYSLGVSGEDAARTLYLRLHQAEENYDYAILERMPETGVYYSVMNRAKKSSS